MANPAETYEREMVPVLFEPWAPLLVELAQLFPGARVLDAACGTGVVARTVAARLDGYGQVTGLDLNPAMLEVARARGQATERAIEWQQGAMEDMPFADRAFDVVLCQHGLQFSPDPPGALAEMRRVAVDDGRLALSVWRGLELHPFFAAMSEAVVRHLGVDALAAPFSMGDAGELHDLLHAAGWHDVRVEAREMNARFPDPQGFIAMEVDVMAAAIPSAQNLDAQARARLAKAVARDMADAIHAATRHGRIEIPMHAHLASARRRG
jgi:SAM-dependent methyltransferase